MPLTISNQPGDNTWNASIEIPDSGTSVNVAGSCNPSGLDGQTDIVFTGSPLAMPSAPVSGFTYWIIEVNMSTGALDVQQSNASMPTGSGAGYSTIFQQTLSPSNTDPALDNTDVTPDQ